MIEGTLRRMFFWVLLAGTVLLILEGGARLLEKAFSALPGPFHAWRKPYGALGDKGGVITHLSRTSIINEGGYIGPYHPPERAPGTYRIVLLGDSMGFGWGVDYQDSWPALLEEGLNRKAAASAPGNAGGPPARIEVLNFSVPGYNTFLELERYRLFAAAYSPDHVIVAYFPNDACIDRYLPNVWRVCPLQWSRTEKLVGIAMEGSGFVRVVHDVYHWVRHGYPGVVVGHPQMVREDNYGLPCSLYWIGELRELLNARGIGLTIVQVPYLGATDLPHDPERQVQEFLERSFRLLGYSTINLYPAVAGHAPRSLLLLPDEHPGVLGHRLLAEYLIPRIGPLGGATR